MENCRPKLRYIFIFCCFISISSCNKKHDFGYDEDKSEYMANVNCFRENYSKIYNSRNHRSPTYFAPVSVTNQAVCGQLFSVMQKHEIAYVSFEKDSTVSFYSRPQGLNNKQFILVFTTAQINIHTKIKKDIKLLDKLDSNCYELEKVN
jgi:hypothetical protein